MSYFVNFRKNLATKTAKDVIGNNFKLVDIESKEKVLVAIEKLLKNNVSSLPVYYEETKKYFGCVDIQDIAMVIFVLAVAKSFVDLFAQQVVEWHDFDNEDFQAFAGENIEQFCNASERNHWKTIKEDTSVLEVMKILSNPAQNVQEKGKGNVRRVGVETGEGKLIGIVSQFGMLQFLLTQIKEHGLFKGTHFKEIQHKNDCSTIYSIQETDLSIEAFKKMLEFRISGVAVLNEKGQLTSVFSSSDVKREKLNQELFSDLRLPAKEYLSKSNRYFKKEIDENAFQISANDSLEAVLDKMNKFHLHHIFQLDENRIPVKNYSLCDIIQGFL
jgi:CBS domain-containing protein